MNSSYFLMKYAGSIFNEMLWYYLFSYIFCKNKNQFYKQDKINLQVFVLEKNIYIFNDLNVKRDK